MNKIHLGVNCTFATNRYTEPEAWTEIVGEELGLRYVQFVSDLLDPYLPYNIQRRICKNILDNCKKYNITIHTTFGGYFVHQHYLGHPDNEIRGEAEKWFRRLINQASLSGASGTGTCFAITSVKDSQNPGRRKYIINEAIKAYTRLSSFAKKKGLKYLIFEPTSVLRETAHTMEETKYLLERCNKVMDIPMRLCLDVGHGSVKSQNSSDADPYKWIRELGALSPVIHIQQTDKTASRHWPFIEKYNKRGIIEPAKIVQAIKDSGAEEVVLVFEITHRAFYPMENQVINDLKESVRYWRKYVKD